MVCAAGLTKKLRVTGAAAAVLPLPDCVAVIEQVPAARIVTVLPETEHTEGVVEEKLTPSPELAVALMVKDGAPKVLLARASKVMV
jgi:hypothetical protein